MKSFEVSSKKSKNGMRKFKAILHEIYPDSCIDIASEAGTIYNENGITWIKEYCENALPTLKDKSIRVEFLNEERDEISGHGMTDSAPDGMPIFEDATIIGHFTGGYIDEIEGNDGEKKTVLIGEGYLDSMCCYNFISKLSEDIENGNEISGSVEIFRTDDNEEIVYKYGYKEFGRIPQEFIYSGFALLGVKPADPTSKLLELNNKEEKSTMTEAEIKAIVTQTVNELSSHIAEIEKCKKELSEQLACANEEKDKAIAEKNEAIATSEQIQAALDSLKTEQEELGMKYDTLWKERCELEEMLTKAKVRERIGEMNEAVSSFSDEEKAYAQTEIDAFNADPVNCEINSIVSKIYEGIGKTAKENAAKVAAEQNSANNVEVEDIFSAVISTEDNSAEDTNIF